MQNFQDHQSSVYSEAEQRMINEYNQALTACLKGGSGDIE